MTLAATPRNPGRCSHSQRSETCETIAACLSVQPAFSARSTMAHCSGVTRTGARPGVKENPRHAPQPTRGEPLRLVPQRRQANDWQRGQGCFGNAASTGLDIVTGSYLTP